MSDSYGIPSLPDRDTLWKHCVKNVLVLDNEDIKSLRKGGVKCMNHFFQYTTNIENFDRRFPNNSPTIVNVRYFIMHYHVNNYKTNDMELMVQDEEKFGLIDVIDLESTYWSLVKMERTKAEPVPKSPDMKKQAHQVLLLYRQLTLRRLQQPQLIIHFSVGNITSQMYQQQHPACLTDQSGIRHMIHQTSLRI